MTFRTVLAASCALAACATFSTAGAGTSPNVAIVAAAQSSSSSAWFTDPQAKILGTGLVASVDIINATSVTPTLAQLQAYDAVLTWSNNDYADPVALGNVLADYVDAGGGVVVAVFANTSTSANRYLQGRWLTGGYEVVVSQGGSQTGSATLGVVHEPSHPVMAGVTTFSGGTSSYRPSSTALTAGSATIASWSDGRTLAARHGSLPQRIDLGFYPPSNGASASFWNATTDGDLLMANALVFVASAGGGALTPFCFGDGSGTACPCGNSGVSGNGCGNSLGLVGANLAASGAASLSTDTLVLTGSGMPNSSALYFQGTSKVAGGAGAVFGDGLRCAGGTIIRLATTTNVAGTSQFPASGDPSVSVRGLVTVPGTRTYQVWYRNAAAFCTASTFNLTNGVEVGWGG